MKKKLQLNKEIVSILDRNQMNNLTKGGAATLPPRCGVGETTPQHCGVVQTLACPTKHDYMCESKVCIDPQTEVCGGESGLCISAPGCETDVCPVETATNCETYNVDCMIPADTVEDCVEKQTFVC